MESPSATWRCRLTTKLNIGGMPGTDLIGAAGFNDEVDRHYKRVFGGALLLSVMTAGITLSQEDDNASGVDQGSTRDQVKNTLATALGQNLGEAASQMLRREMNVQPMLRIRPGYRFNVLVNKDLIFEGPYLNTFVGGGLLDSLRVIITSRLNANEKCLYVFYPALQFCNSIFEAIRQGYHSMAQERGFLKATYSQG